MATLKELQVEHEQVSKSLLIIKNQLTSLLAKQDELQERKSILEVEIEQKQLCDSYIESDKLLWSSYDFVWTQEVFEKLRDVFGMDSFRPKQKEVINATLSNRDLLLVMSTGGGKSLCYQLPALLSVGVTLVISPLISLMEDQKFCLQKHGIVAELLNADSPKELVQRVYQAMTSKDSTNIDIKLIYVTPEKLSKSKRFMAQLEKCYKAGNLARIAIDEVHCTSQWGNDFRPDYKFLGILKRQFSKTPIIGLTATAASNVITDIKKMLNIPLALVFKTPLNRTNLFYEVRAKPKSHDETISDMALTINTNFKDLSGIVYCFSRKDATEVSNSLNKFGIKSCAYHAFLPSEIKSAIHSSWIAGKIQVICATIAFGMGINKPDVRFVIHYSISKSVENYYQESGRAGRDGKPALCLLYFGFLDMFKQSAMVLTEKTGLENLSHMIKYSQNLRQCRRNLLAQYFDEPWESSNCNDMCDVCSNMINTTKVDITEHCQALLDVINSAECLGDGHRLTGCKLLDSAAGRGKCKTSNKALKTLGIAEKQRIIIYMLLNNYLREDFHFTPYSTISYLVSGSLSMLDETIYYDMPTNDAFNSRSVIYNQTFSFENCSNNYKGQKLCLVSASTESERKRISEGSLSSTSDKCYKRQIMHNDIT